MLGEGSYDDMSVGTAEGKKKRKAGMNIR